MEIITTDVSQLKYLNDRSLLSMITSTMFRIDEKENQIFIDDVTERCIPGAQIF